MITSSDRIGFILNNERVSHRTNKFWKLLLLYLSLIITIAILPGGINIYIIIFHAMTIYLFSKIVIDKGNLLNSLSVSNNKIIKTIYISMFTVILIFNLVGGLIIFLFKIITGFTEEVMEFRFNSLKEFTAFLILYLILFFLTAPLCFIKKNPVWFAWFFGSNTIFTIFINLLNLSSNLNHTILIGLVILILTVFISFKASLYFNRPKRYMPLQKPPKSITI